MNAQPLSQKWKGRACFYCGGQADTRDHLIPRSRGGVGLLDNKVDACMRCNNDKGTRTLDEYRLHVLLRDGRGLAVEPQGRPRDWLFVSSPTAIERIVEHHHGRRPRRRQPGTGR